MNRFFSLLALFCLTALAAASAFAAPAFAKVMAAVPQPPAAVASGLETGVHFSLVDGDGKPVTEKSWPGKYQLVFFGFTHCPDICPVTLDKLSTALGKLGPDADKVKTLFITTDPARDTPAVVKTYVGNVNKSITGLTGTEAQVKGAEDAFKVYAVKNTDNEKDGDYAVDHSAFIYLMSPEGKLLEVMGSDAGANDIVEKVKGHLG